MVEGRTDKVEPHTPNNLYISVHVHEHHCIVIIIFILLKERQRDRVPTPLAELKYGVPVKPVILKRLLSLWVFTSIIVTSVSHGTLCTEFISLLCASYRRIELKALTLVQFKESSCEGHVDKGRVQQQREWESEFESQSLFILLLFLFAIGLMYLRILFFRHTSPEGI